MPTHHHTLPDVEEVLDAQGDRYRQFRRARRFGPVRPGGAGGAARRQTAIPGVRLHPAAPRHPSNAAVNAIKDLGKANGFTVQSNGDPTQFTEENLARFRAVILLADSDDALNADQQAAFEAYYTNGGGVLAIHSAIETEPDWDFLTDVLGARSSGRTTARRARSRSRTASTRRPASCPSTGTERSPGTTSTSTSGASATSWPRSPRTRSTRTHRGPVTGIAGGTMGFDHPIAWCKDFQGGRSFYTGVGSTPAASRTPCTARTCSGRSAGRPASPTRSIPTAGPRSSRTSSRPC